MTTASRPIPYLDLGRQYESIKHELWPAIQATVERSQFVLGPAVEAFERDFAAYCEAADHIGVSSGTAALHLALVAHGIGAGDEVITQANTFAATLEAIAYTGATIVLVDVAPPAYAIDAAAVAAAVTPRTKAIIPVHLFGMPAPMDALAEIAQRSGITIIEDASQAHGARYRGRRIGASHTAAFSFYPGKNLGAYGDAGGITTSDRAVAARLRSLRNHGSRQRYVHDEIGYNDRMDGIQGAVLQVKLDHLDRWNAERRAVAQRYDRLLRGIARPAVPDDVEHVYHIYPIFVEDRAAVQNALAAAGVETNVHYPIACHQQAAFAHLGYPAGAFPQAEYMARTELSLPIYPGLDEAATRCVADVLHATVR